MTSLQPRVIDFVDLLKELNDQNTLAELNDALAALISAVRECGDKGTLTYQVTIDPLWLDEGQEVRFGFDDKITLKLPSKKRSKEFLFAGRGTSLYTSNPFKPDPDEHIIDAEIVEEPLDDDMFSGFASITSAPDSQIEDEEYLS